MEALTGKKLLSKQQEKDAMSSFNYFSSSWEKDMMLMMLQR